MISPPRKLLCVEDEPMLLEDLALELRDAGYHVTEMADGMSAMSAALSEPFDLIVSDMRMPQMDGLEMLTEMRRGDGPNTKAPFVLLTAYDDAAQRGRCAELGNTSFIIKPVDYAKLLALLDEAFAAIQGTDKNTYAALPVRAG